MPILRVAAAALSVGLWALPAAALAQAPWVQQCEPHVTDLRNIVEPWGEHSRTWEGGIRVTVVDTIEPACCATHLVVLSPDDNSELGDRACHVISAEPGTGFAGVDFGSVSVAAAPDGGLEIDFSYAPSDPATGTEGTWRTTQVVIPAASRPADVAPLPDMPLVGGRDSVAARFLGSWLPAAGSTGRNEVVTFNPDGTRTVSDGAGMSATDHWDLANGQLTIDGRPVELELDGYGIVLAGERMERFTLHGEAYEGRSLAPGLDPYGFFVPAGEEVRIGDYALNYVFVLTPDEFAARTAAPAAAPSPIEVQFWNTTEEIKMAESGNAYRDDLISFAAHAYAVTTDGISFHGTHPEWGEIFFSGTFDPTHIAPGEGHGPAITGDLMVRGFVFRDVALVSEGLH